MARVSTQFYWPNLKDDVKTFVKHCVVCQQAKTTNSRPAGLLNHLPVPEQVWEDIAMDFITGLPTSFGFNVFMVMVDRLSKYAHFVAMKTDYTINICFIVEGISWNCISTLLAITFDYY